jgi:phosphoglycerate dehydrogenase-like enzyme
MMRMGEEFLAAAPRLEAVFYGGGTVRGFVTDAFWERDILLTSAWTANAIPVAEFAVAAIVFGLKKAVPAARTARRERTFRWPGGVLGVYRAKVGVIGVGAIGRLVLEKLRGYNVRAFCCDPRLGAEEAASLDATPLGMEEIFRTCDAVSLHAPNLPSTAHMVTGEHFRSMKDGAVFINTARGRIVDERGMVEVLRERRIFAFIDVTDPEPPPPESALYRLPNVFLTPHIAGAMGREARRNGDYAIEELRRHVAGEQPRHPVTRDMMAWMA